MTDFIIIAVLLVIVCAAAWYVYKAKKSGQKCIGCPDGGCNCSASSGHPDCGCGCGCGCSEAGK